MGRDLKFFLENIFLASQLLDMSHANVGHNSRLRPCNRRKNLHLPEIAHTHFQNGKLILSRHLRHGNGKSDITVEILRGTEHPESRAQCRSHHLSCGGFSHASGDTYHGDSHTLSVVSSHSLKGFQGVVHLDPGSSGKRLRFPAGKHRRRAVLNGLCQVIMSIRVLSDQGHKEIVSFHFSGINAYMTDELLRISG